jgi:hypothetical protein
MQLPSARCTAGWVRKLKGLLSALESKLYFSSARAFYFPIKCWQRAPYSASVIEEHGDGKGVKEKRFHISAVRYESCMLCIPECVVVQPWVWSREKKYIR